jgi:hypothetical protein
MPTKVCNKCKVEKPLSAFHTDKTLSSGVRGICKVCGLSYAKSRYHTDPEYKQKSNERSMGYYWNRRARDPMYRRKPIALKTKRIKRVRRRVPKLAQVPETRVSETCRILQAHHTAMKDDPDHLTTEFIQKLVGVECDV